MTKLNLGDYVLVDYMHKKGYVIGDRGGYVGRWKIKFDNGEVGQASTRDCTILIPAHPQNRRLTVNDKLDMLLDYLGLDIEDNPKIVKKSEAQLTSEGGTDEDS